MPEVYLIRKRNGNAIGMAVDPASYAEVDPVFFSVVIDPPIPDGRGLDPPKIFDGINLRNATPQEKGLFNKKTGRWSKLLAEERADATLMLSEKVKSVFREGGSKRLWRSVLQVLIAHINFFREKDGQPLLILDEVIAEIDTVIDSGDHN